MEFCMPYIMISYRRSDSQEIARLIFERLIVRYGKQSVFMDVHEVSGIPIGTDFKKYIDDTLQRTDFLIAVVGPQWLRFKGNAVSQFFSRFRNLEDYVRFEVETALDRKIHVIPVLVRGARMPTQSELPPNLRAFATINALKIDAGEDFNAHINQLIERIDHPPAILGAHRGPYDLTVKEVRRHITAFISHAREDNNDAKQCKAALENATFDVWKYDPRPNARHLDTVEHEIEYRDFFLLFLSEVSLSKPFIHREVWLAHEVQRRNRGYRPLIIFVLSSRAAWTH